MTVSAPPRSVQSRQSGGALLQEQERAADAQVLHQLLRRVLLLPRPMQGNLQHVQLGVHLHQRTLTVCRKEGKDANDPLYSAQSLLILTVFAPPRSVQSRLSGAQNVMRTNIKV